MRKLDHAGLLELRARFDSLHDAWICRVELDLNGDQPRMCWFLRAIEFPKGFEEWGKGPQPHSVQLKLELRGLEAWTVKQLPNYTFGLVFEGHIDFVGEQVYVDFDYQHHEHEFVAERFNDPDNWTWLVSSERYALGSELWWEVNEVDQ